MKRVSLICTVHEENGLANVSVLLAILERVRPEVIFLEIPAAAFGAYVDGTCSNLESSAARRYREIHRVELVPVDLPTPEEEFFRTSKELSDRIEGMSPEYRRLIDLNRQVVSAYGFAYLNSERCSKLWSEVHEAMLATIEQLSDHRLVELYELWNRTNERRDKAMMKNIENYCTQNAFDIGVLLVGAAHRQSIIDKSREQYVAGSPIIQWDFAGFLEGTAITIV